MNMKTLFRKIAMSRNQEISHYRDKKISLVNFWTYFMQIDYIFIIPFLPEETLFGIATSWEKSKKTCNPSPW